MPKTKLKIGTDKLLQLKAVAELNDVRVGDEKVLGETTFIEMNYKQPQQLFDMGVMSNSLSKSQAESLLASDTKKETAPTEQPAKAQK